MSLWQQISLSTFYYILNMIEYCILNGYLNLSSFSFTSINKIEINMKYKYYLIVSFWILLPIFKWLCVSSCQFLYLSHRNKLSCCFYVQIKWLLFLNILILQLLSFMRINISKHPPEKRVDTAMIKKQWINRNRDTSGHVLNMCPSWKYFAP